jgi:hypothetical protein
MTNWALTHSQSHDTILTVSDEDEIILLPFSAGCGSLIIASDLTVKN